MDDFIPDTTSRDTSDELEIDASIYTPDISDVDTASMKNESSYIVYFSQSDIKKISIEFKNSDHDERIRKSIFNERK